jgi:hypothetical protein
VSDNQNKQSESLPQLIFRAARFVRTRTGPAMPYPSAGRAAPTCYPVNDFARRRQLCGPARQSGAKKAMEHHRPCPFSGCNRPVRDAIFACQVWMTLEKDHASWAARFVRSRTGLAMPHHRHVPDTRHFNIG